MAFETSNFTNITGIKYPVPLLLSHPNHAIPYIVLNLMASVLGVIGNIFILIVFTKYKKLKVTGFEFIINLAIADLIVTAYADPMCILGKKKFIEII